MTTGSAKIYTRTGDKGKTSLIGGTRVSKSNSRLEAYGTFDELNSVVGLLIEVLKSTPLPAAAPPIKTVDGLLTNIQNDLFNLGSHLACEDANLRTQLPSVTEVHIQELEKAMDEFSSELPPLKNFILPGGSRAGGFAHLARTVCRRAERATVALQETDHVEDDVIIYINRLSDFFFVLARHLNRLFGNEETIWAPRKP